MIPASHPLVGPSLRLQLGAAKLLVGGGWLRETLLLAVPLIRRRIDLQCASGPNYFNITHSPATVAAQETAFERAGTLYGGVYARRREGEHSRRRDQRR
jgi:hypothetical protein